MMTRPCEVVTLPYDKMAGKCDTKSNPREIIYKLKTQSNNVLTKFFWLSPYFYTLSIAFNKEQ